MKSENTDPKNTLEYPTTLKNALSSLSSNWWKQAFDNSSWLNTPEAREFAIWQWKADKKQWFFNAECTRLLNLPEQFGGEPTKTAPPLCVFLPNKLSLNLKQILELLGTEEQVVEVLCEIGILNGPRQLYGVNSHQVLDEKGKLRGYIGFLWPMVPRDKGKFVPSVSRQVLEQLQANGRIGYFITNLKRDTWTASPYLKKLLNLDRTHYAKASDWLSSVRSDHRVQVLRVYQESLKEQKPFKVRCPFISLFEELPLWVELQGRFVFDETKGASLLVITVRDIREEVFQKEKIYEQNKQLRQWASLQAHEVRPPISRVRTLITAFRNGLIEPTEIDTYLGHIEESILELDEIVKNVTQKINTIEKERNPEDQPQFNRLLIHLVDDDPMIRRLHQLQLNRFGLAHLIVEAADGRSLVKNLEAQKNPHVAHLVLLDLNMPDFNGWDVLDYLGKADREGQVMVAVVSSSTDLNDLQRSYEHDHIIDFIEKPLSFEALNRLFGNEPIKSLIKKEINLSPDQD